METGTEQLINAFLNQFRVALGNSSIYSSTHSVFLKSIEEFYNKLDPILIELKQIEILVGPRYLIIEKQKWEGDALYEDLARWFHVRSVKSFAIKRGVTPEEIVYFISNVSLRPREILDRGGIERILQENNIASITVEPLSYFEILKSTRGDKDIWAFLLNDALTKEDVQEVEAVVNNYNRMLRDIGASGVVEEGELRSKLEEFLDYLKEHNEEAFTQCVVHTLKSLCREPDVLKEHALPEKFQNYFQELDARDFAQIVFDNLVGAETPEFREISFYSSFISQQTHEIVLRLVSEKIERRESPGINVEWVEKMSALCASSGQQIIREMYAPMMTMFQEKFSREDVFHYDRESWPIHYRTSLLNLFAGENDDAELAIITSAITEEWHTIKEEDQMMWYQRLLETREGKSDRNQPADQSLNRLDQFIGQFIETKALTATEDELEKLDYLISLSRQGVLGAQRYLEAIFNQNDIRPSILKIFFKFYGPQREQFFQYLNMKLEETQYILKFLKNIESLDQEVKLDIYKRLFATPNAYIRLEALKRMSELSICDKSFLLEILKNKDSDYHMRQYSLKAVMVSDEARREAAEILFSKSGPYGGNRKALIGHMQMAAEVGLKESIDWIEKISQRRFFWNAGLRAQANITLKELNDGRKG
ncbi:MAG: hypothetical protein AB1650_01465 [Candidatus Omnitrophota bacterium]